MAFIDLGDQLSPFRRAAGQLADDGRHFGLVVDDKEAARKALEALVLRYLMVRSLIFGTLGATQ